MANLTALGRSKIARAIYQGGALPTTRYFALAKVNKGVFVAGATYAVGDYVIASAWNQRLYKCTTAGVSGAEPAWPVVAGGTVTSGAATFTEQSTALLGGTFAEADYTGYARATVACNSGNFSEDASGNVANLNAISFGAGNTGTAQTVAVVLEMDAGAAGNVLSVEPMTNPQVANVGASAVTTPAGSFTFAIS
jgi:hypothetical protein